MNRLLSHLALSCALASAGAATAASVSATDVARSRLGELQARVRQLAQQEGSSDNACQQHRRILKEADAALSDVDLANDARRGEATRAAQRAQEKADESCRQHAEDGRRWQAARTLLRDAMASFERCTTQPADGPCQRVISLAEGELAVQGAVTLAEARAAALSAQATVTKLEDAAALATKLSDKAVSDSLSHDAKSGDARRKLLSDTAQTSHQAAHEVRVAAEGAATLSRDLVDDALAVSGCETSAQLCPHDSEQRRIRIKALDTELARRQADAKAALEIAKLASFQVQAGVLSASAEERAAMLRFLQLVDRNPDAKGLFGGEAVRLSAGKKGGEAAIRVDLDRFAGSPSRDLSLILSAPVGDDSSAALYDSVDGTASGLTATLAYRFTPQLQKSKRAFDRYLYQVGAKISLGYASHTYRAPDDVATAIKSRSKPWALGAQVIYANVDANLLHQLGVDYKVETGYDGVGKSTRCPAVPAGSLSVACVNAYFEPPEQRAGWVLSYDVRFKLGKIALAPSLAYERRTRVKSLDLPLYLIGDVDKKTLTAGVALSHSTAGKDDIEARTKVRLFVSSPFSVFGH